MAGNRPSLRCSPRSSILRTSGFPQSRVFQRPGADRPGLELVAHRRELRRPPRGTRRGPHRTTSSRISPSRTTPNRQIGRYSIVRELGRGGMGTVYLAEYEGDGFRKQVAIKVLRRGVDTEDVLRRFMTERRILGFAEPPEHRAACRWCAPPRDGQPYLVMEFVEGGVDHSLLRSQSPHDPRAASPDPASGRSCRLRTRQPDRPSRSQAVQHPRYPRRSRQTAGFRHREAARCRR